MMSLDFSRLTARESECLGLMAEGMTAKEIADLWSIRADSVDRLILNARVKLGGPSRHRIVWAYRSYKAGQAHRDAAGGSDRDAPADHFSESPRFSGALESSISGETFARKEAAPDQARLPDRLLVRLINALLALEWTGRRNELGWRRTLFAVCLVVAGSVVTVAAGLLIFFLLDQLLRVG
jgi:DNA-binding CsgD family transcriptional regulator